jgi:hypothetical protein
MTAALRTVVTFGILRRQGHILFLVSRTEHGAPLLTSSRVRGTSPQVEISGV